MSATCHVEENTFKTDGKKIPPGMTRIKWIFYKNPGTKSNGNANRQPSADDFGIELNR
jgi:hypothetical protein